MAWLRYSAGRWLTWNSNYNVKPREISAAQARALKFLKSPPFLVHPPLSVIK